LKKTWGRGFPIVIQKVKAYEIVGKITETTKALQKKLLTYP